MENRVCGPPSAGVGVKERRNPRSTTRNDGTHVVTLLQLHDGRSAVTPCKGMSAVHDGRGIRGELRILAAIAVGFWLAVGNAPFLIK